MKPFASLPFLAPTIALSLAGCDSAEPSLPGEPAAASQAVDAEDMRAARSLSIGNVRALDDSVGPYIQALRCRIALDAINEHFGGSGRFSDELKQGVSEAQAIYERQLARLGAQAGKSSEEIQSDLSEQAERIPALSTRSQILIGCLSRLA